MDLLFLEEFASSSEFLNIFLSKIGLENSDIIEVEQSKVDMEYGESDMTLIVEKDNKNYVSYSWGSDGRYCHTGGLV